MKISLLPQNKKSKFKNRRCIANGITFDSIHEAKRYVVLFYKQSAGEIFKLEIHKKFNIVVNGEKICTYESDFTYFNKSGARIVEDAKGVKTPVYKLKKKLMLAVHGITITEV